jgi:very-short-patch-repair endonuclease
MEGQTNRCILRKRVQRLLRSNMTLAELRLWQRLRGKQLYGWKFRRQHPYGDYVLDFVCLDAKLVVEVAGKLLLRFRHFRHPWRSDGGQHVERRQVDEARDANLRAAGFQVLRFWNNQVMQESEAVIEVIVAALPVTPSPP